MKTINVSIILCLIFMQKADTSCHAQNDLSFSFDEYTYFVGEQQFYICEIIIENTDDGEYVFWFDTANIVKYNNKEKISSYFHQRKGDFSFYNLMTENLLKNQPPILFGTFLRRIGKQEEFIIRVMGDKPLVNVCQKFIKEHLAAVKKEELIESLKLTDDFFSWFDRQSINIKLEFIPEK